MERRVLGVFAGAGALVGVRLAIDILALILITALIVYVIRSVAG